MIAKPKSKPKKKVQLKRKVQPAQKSKLNTKLTKIGLKKPERSSINNQVKASSMQKMHTGFHPVPKPGTRNGIRQVSNRQRERERNLLKLNHYLRAKRADHHCEIPGCFSSWHMQGAHIIGRGIGGKDNAGNLIEVCGDHHDHVEYGNGLPMDTQKLLALIDEKNRERGISKFMTGDQVPNGEEYEDFRL
jgi:hypothetical protein